MGYTKSLSTIILILINIFLFHVVSVSQQNINDTDIDKTVQDLYEEGRSYYFLSSANNYKKAIECYHKAIELDSDFALPYSGIAEAYAFLGFIKESNNRESYDEYRKSLDYAMIGILKDADRCETHRALGLAYLVIRKKSDAQKEIDKALSICPDDAESWYLKTFFYDDSLIDVNSKSYKMIQKSRKLNPKFILPLTDIANEYRKAGNNDKAVEYYYKALELNPENTFVLNNLGLLFLQKENFDKAKELLSKALEIEKDNYRLYLSYGLIHFYQNQYNKAIQYFNKALSTNPQDPEVIYRLGLTYFTMEDYDRAVEYYKEALKINPNLRVAIDGIALCYYRKKEFKQAAQFYIRSIAAGNKNFETFGNLGLSFYLIKKYGHAIYYFNKALEHNPKSPFVNNNLAWLYVTAEDSRFYNPDLAIKHGEIAVKNSRGKVSAHLDTLAEAHFSVGNVKKAYQLIQKALKINPEDKELKDKLNKYKKALSNNVYDTDTQ